MKITLFLLLILISTIAKAEFRVYEIGGGALVQEDGKNILFYQKDLISPPGVQPRSHYIHPLYALDGSVLTVNYPEGHLHQRGLFWAWPQVLVNNRLIANQWQLKGIRMHVTDFVTLETENGLMMNMTVHWTSPEYKNDAGEEEPFLREETSVLIHPRKDNYRVIDFTLGGKALTWGVKLGGSEDRKGYGGFSYRIKLPEDLTFKGQYGEVEPQVTGMREGPWMDIRGDLTESGRAGVLVVQHPKNPGYPNEWVLRREGSMQNAKFPGREPVEVPTENTGPGLRYRMVIYEGELDEGDRVGLIEEYQQN